MKDYTKYDFTPIMGAEVSVLLKSKVEYGGTLKLISDKAIFLLMNDNPLALEGRWFAIEDIVPGSLTAKIKVEDMSLKQMMEFCFHEGNCNYVVLYNDKTCVSTCGKHAKNIELTDYIDCTDWGWKHE